MNIIKGNHCDWEVIIGLEVHAQVASNTKLFSGSSTKFGSEPNTQVSLFDAALPGMLPLLNTFCIEQLIKTGLALSAEISNVSFFDRKNYFYPDLPQGYQITQFYKPIVRNAKITLEDSAKKTIKIERIHLEQDAGKSIHENNKTYIDLNRSGIALMEIVSEPDLRSSQEAAEYMKKLRMILRYVGSCDGDMEKGSLRCDANVSVRPVGSNKLGVRSEIKNLNSIRYIAQAIDYEANRQVKVLEEGGVIDQNTLLFDINSGQTKIMRTKENAHDYRYFPDPDMLSVKVDISLIESLRNSLPELPIDKKNRYINELNLNEDDANIIVSDKEIADYFEQVSSKHEPKFVVPWIIVELFGRLNKAGISINECTVKPNAMIELLDLIKNNTISGKIAKQVFDIMFETGKSPSFIVKEHKLEQISDDGELVALIDKIIADNQDKVAEYKNGKIKLFGYFVGQVMKETQGRANPELVNSLLQSKLV